MLLVSEIPGATFDSSIDPALAESLTSPISEGMTVEPTECTKLVDISAKLASVPTALAQISDQSLSASISLSKQSSLYDELTGASDGCGDVTVTADGNAVARNELEAQNLPPEAMDFLKDMDLKSTFSVHTRPWDPQLSSSPQKVTAEESYGEGTVAGVKTNVTSYRIIGIVNGVVIAVSTVPTPSADHIRMGEAGLTIENPEISQEAKDAAKARAIEIFDAQAQKVRAAK
nr:hypothetical protein [Corynebacterium lactis]